MKCGLGFYRESPNIYRAEERVQARDAQEFVWDR